MKKFAVIMAGGLGSRFWPRSTEKCPKQFIHLTGEGTMIQNSYERLVPFFQPEDIYVVANSQMAELIEKQLPSLSKENIILEPLSRGTAPCLALCLTKLKEKYEPDTVMLAFPSDHFIQNIREFHNSLFTGSQIAYEREAIVTIGLTPTRPETAYGYVQIKEEPGDLGDYFKKGVRFSTTFAEKPDINTAQRFVESGDFLWNSGIFIWRVDTFWEAFNRFLPEHSRLFKILNRIKTSDSFNEALKDVYKQMQTESVDYAILEKASNVYVVKSSFNWSDLGTWDELYRLSMKDARNNFIEGDVVSFNVSNSLISSKGRLIGIVGVDNLVVVDSDDAILICKRTRSNDVKEIVDFLKRKNINRFL